MGDTWQSYMERADEALRRGDLALAEVLLRGCLREGTRPPRREGLDYGTEFWCAFGKLEAAYLAQGKDHDAELVRQRHDRLLAELAPGAVAAAEKEFGSDDPRMALLLHAAARVQHRVGEHESAHAFEERARRIWTRFSLAIIPDTAVDPLPASDRDEA